ATPSLLLRLEKHRGDPRPAPQKKRPTYLRTVIRVLQGRFPAKGRSRGQDPVHGFLRGVEDALKKDDFAAYIAERGRSSSTCCSGVRPSRRSAPSITRAGYADDVAAFVRRNPTPPLCANLWPAIRRQGGRLGYTAWPKSASLRTVAVVFTSAVKWEMKKPHCHMAEHPLQEKEVKYLGVTLTHDLRCRRSTLITSSSGKTLLCQLRRAIGPTWGLSPLERSLDIIADHLAQYHYAVSFWTSRAGAEVPPVSGCTSFQGRFCRAITARAFQDRHPCRRDNIPLDVGAEPAAARAFTCFTGWLDCSNGRAASGYCHFSTRQHPGRPTEGLRGLSRQGAAATQTATPSLMGYPPPVCRQVTAIIKQVALHQQHQLHWNSLHRYSHEPLCMPNLNRKVSDLSDFALTRTTSGRCAWCLTGHGFFPRHICCKPRCPPTCSLLFGIATEETARASRHFCPYFSTRRGHKYSATPRRQDELTTADNIETSRLRPGILADEASRCLHCATCRTNLAGTGAPPQALILVASFTLGVAIGVLAAPHSRRLPPPVK
uniref:Phorbol-ester/DAG-type domain-containing protein n=1 Tax=Macrostomum lignano TaxID=282301 RepID=A0A1I8FLC5_9PLAT